MKLRLPKALMTAMAAAMVAVTPMAVTVATGGFAVAALAAPQVQAELVWGWDDENGCPTVRDDSVPDATAQDVTYGYINTGGAGRNPISHNLDGTKLPDGAPADANVIINYTSEGNMGSTLDWTGHSIKFTTGTHKKANGTTAYPIGTAGDNQTQVYEDGSTFTPNNALKMKANGSISANSIWLASGRFSLTDQLIENAGAIYAVGGQLFLGNGGKVDNQVFLGHSDNTDGNAAMAGAALRVGGDKTDGDSDNAQATLSSVTLVENAKVAVYGDNSTGNITKLNLGNHTLTKDGSGTLIITRSEGGSGNIFVQKGTLKLTSSSDSATFDSATFGWVKNEKNDGAILSFEGGKTYNVNRLSNDQGTINITAGTTVNITGTASADTMANAAFMVENMGGKTSHFNISGKLISNAAMSLRDGTGNLNVKDGGELVLKKGLALIVNGITWGNVYINVENGGTLSLGNFDIDSGYSSGTKDGELTRLAVTLANGATIAADATETSVDFKSCTVTIASDATVNLMAGTDKKLTFEDKKIAGAATLNLKGGGTVGLGKALAVAAGDTATSHTAVTGTDSTTLELANSSAATYKSDVSGAVNVEFSGAGTKGFEGEGTYSGSTTVKDGKVELSGSISGTSSLVVSNGGELGLTGEASHVSIGNVGEESALTISNNGSGSTSGVNITYTAGEEGAAGSVSVNTSAELAKLSSVDLKAVVSMEMRNVAMQDVGITSVNQLITYGENVKAVVSHTSMEAAGEAGAAPMVYRSGNTESTLTTTAVQTGGSASGSLTVDVAYSLLSANRGETLKLMVFDNVIMSSDFQLQLGDVLSTIINNGKPEVTLTVDDGTTASNHTITAADIKTVDYNLLDVVNGVPVTGATVYLTITNIPEPATGALSVLALAALAARRRRGKKN